MMPIEENKAVGHRINEEIMSKRNLELVDEIFAANYVCHGISGMDIKGIEDYKQLLTTMFTAFPDLHMTMEDEIAEGDKVVHRLTARGTHKGKYMGVAPTGKQITWMGVAIQHFEGGKIVESWLVVDQLGMMQQMGVVPPMGSGGS